jgi:hypothetical protein
MEYLTFSVPHWKMLYMGWGNAMRRIIQPVIGHIKHDHRMIRNYLSGTQGNGITTLLAATGFNMMKMLTRIKAESLNFCFYLLATLENNIKLKIQIGRNQGVYQA